MKDSGEIRRNPPTQIESLFSWGRHLVYGEIPGSQEMIDRSTARPLPPNPLLLVVTKDLPEQVLRFVTLYPNVMGIRQVNVAYSKHSDELPAEVSTAIYWWSAQPTVQLFQPRDPEQELFGFYLAGGIAKFYEPENPDELEKMISVDYPHDPRGSRQYWREPRLVITPRVDTTLSPEGQAAVSAAMQAAREGLYPVASCEDYADSLRQMADLAAANIMEVVAPALVLWSTVNGIQTPTQYHNQQLLGPYTDES